MAITPQEEEAKALLDQLLSELEGQYFDFWDDSGDPRNPHGTGQVDGSLSIELLLKCYALLGRPLGKKA